MTKYKLKIREEKREEYFEIVSRVNKILLAAEELVELLKDYPKLQQDYLDEIEFSVDHLLVDWIEINADKHPLFDFDKKNE